MVFYILIGVGIFSLIRFSILGSLSVFLVSTLFNDIGLYFYNFFFKIEYFNFVIFLFVLFINEFTHTKKFTIPVDYKLFFIIYVIFTSIIAKYIFPNILVWPVGSSAISTNIDSNLDHLIPLYDNNNFLKQFLFILYPIIFFILINKITKSFLELAIIYYIKVIFFICLTNLIIQTAFIMLPNINLFDYLDPLFSKILSNDIIYRYATLGNRIGRISLFIGEPSFASIYILPVIFYLLLHNFFKIYIPLSYKNLIIIVLFANILLQNSTSGLISFLLISISFFIFNINIKKIFSIIFLILILMALAYFIFSSFFNIYLIELSDKFISPDSSIWIRIWSINHSLGLILSSPLIGIGIGGSIATSGILVFVSSFGFIGTLIFLRFIYFKLILTLLFKKSFSYELYILSFTIYSFVICNLLAGDITTIFLPILFIFICLFKKNYDDIS